MPYFDDDAAEIIEETEAAGAFSLNQQVEIDGEVWVAEGPATPAPAPLAPRAELHPTLEANDSIQKSGEYLAIEFSYGLLLVVLVGLDRLYDKYFQY